MKNKVYSSKFAASFSLISIIVFTITEIANLYFLISNLISGEDVLFEIIMFVGFLPFLLLYLFMGNRFGYIVTYDAEKNTIYRKGLIFGYKYQIKVDDIQDIVIATFPKETTYYILIDPYNKKYEGGYKESFIRIEKNDENLKFIMSFWNKPIKSTN